MDTIEKILNLMNLKGLDEASQASLSKNRHMFEIISYCDETNDIPYMYMKIFLHIQAQYPYHYQKDSSAGQMKGYLFIYTFEGEGLLDISGEPVHADSKSICFCPLDSVSSIRIVSSQWQHVSIFLDGSQVSWFYSHFNPVENYKITVPDSSRIKDMLIAYEHQQNYYKNSPLHQLCFITSLLSETLSINVSKQTAANIPKYLTDIKQRFDKHYSEFFSLDMLEKEYNVSKYRIVKDFTRYYKTSPIYYLSKRRIEAAKALLLSTDYKINEIGRMVGYENSTHFINSFKKQTGSTPLHYKKENSNNF